MSALILLSCFLMGTVPGAKAGIPEPDIEPAVTTSSCYCLAEEPCTELLKNCQDTAIKNHDNGNYTDEQYQMFSLVYCPDAYKSCRAKLYGDD